jgi:hypothetical protein
MKEKKGPEKSGGCCVNEAIDDHMKLMLKQRVRENRNTP